MKKIVLLALSVLGVGHVHAQLAPTSFTFTTTTPAKSTHSGKGWGTDAGFETANTYSMRFGETSNGVDGVNRFITNFVANSLTYKPVDAVSSNAPFTKVMINRVGNANVAAGVARVSSFFENNSPTSGDATIYLKPTYVNTMEAYINSKICNRGSDNLFANADATTLNNVERVDMIMTNGISATNVALTGFLTIERGGNDNCKIAAILALDASGNVKTLGPLVSIAPANWGQSNVMIPTTVIMKDPSDADLRPKQNLTEQAISGTFASCAALGIATGQVFYGVALFPGDVTSANDLIGLTDVPTNTDGSTNGGVDFMAGGGFFIEQNTVLASIISGNVYDDANALTDGLVNGTALSVVSTQQLYAYLVKNGVIVARDVVDNVTGGYSLGGTFNTAFTVVISTSNLANGDQAPTSANLPAGWIATGENFGVANSAGTGNETGTPDLKIAVTTPVAGNVTAVNFGIEQLPTAGTISQANQLNPGGALSATVAATTFIGADADGTVTGIRLTAFPSNATSITVGTTTYYSVVGQIPGTCPTTTCAVFPVVGVSIATNTSGQPTPTIKVDPIDGATTVGIPYKAVDNAGKESLTAGSANVPFIVPPVALDDKGSSTIVQAVSVNLLTNDKLGNTTQATGALTDVDLDPKTPGIQHSLTVAGEGTWTYVKATGVITFAPITGLTKNPTPIPYTLSETSTGLTSNAIVTITYTPLPVTLISFSVSKQESAVRLMWKTSAEENSDRFNIERSLNGKAWEEIGTKNANGESASILNYSFDDVNPLSGINYYRLKMIDKDGTYAFSSIRSIDMTDNEKSALYPNPATSSITIPNQEGNVVNIYDVSGILKLTSTVINGQINTQKLTDGIYVMQIKNASGGVTSKKFVIHK